MGGGVGLESDQEMESQLNHMPKYSMIREANMEAGTACPFLRMAQSGTANAPLIPKA